MPEVSIVIPCYNYARFLPEAVRSAVSQSFRDIEITIVNDGSSDNTSEVAHSIAGSHPEVKIKVVEQENAGVSAARNAGIAAAEGEYIVPLDADDVLRPDYIEKTLAALKASPGASLAYTWTESFGKESGIYRNGEFNRRGVVTRDAPPQTFLLRKSVWEEVGGYKPEMRIGGEDWEFACSLFEAGFKAAAIPEPLFLYRKHGPSRLSGETKKSLRVARDIKLLHPRLFEPGLSRISVRLAKAVLWIKYCTRDRIGHYLYVRFPSFHRRLARIKYGLMKE